VYVPVALVFWWGGIKGPGVRGSQLPGLLLGSGREIRRESVPVALVFWWGGSRGNQE
jgi:hypothetical protein